MRVPGTPALTKADLTELRALLADVVVPSDRDTRPGELKALLGAGFYQERVQARGDRYRLTPDEMAAIAAFCAQEPINRSLKAARPEHDAMHPVVRALDRALAKLPAVRGHFFRFETGPDAAAAYSPGKIVERPLFVSTSKRFRELPDPILMLDIYSHSGRDVSSLSGYPSEEEVLIPRGGRFLVEGIDRFQQNGQSYTRVRLRELPR